MAPRDLETRPPLDMQKQAVMNSVGQILKGAKVLDLFAGSGSLGIEALSRGAVSCDFVENARPAVQALKKNLEALGLDRDENVSIITKSLPDALSQFESEAYTVVFSDPPFGDILKGVFLNMEALVAPLLAEGGVLVNRVPAGCPVMPEVKELKLRRCLDHGISFMRILEKVG